MARSENVSTFFDSTQFEESKFEVCTQEFHVAIHIKTPFDNALYLRSLLSDLTTWGHFLQFLNLKNLTLKSHHKNFMWQCTLRQMNFIWQCALRHFCSF